jgi:hypothetical protein
MLSGEIDLELDSGEVIHAKSGDVVLNRGGLHTWVDKGSVPARMAVVLVDAKRVEVNGKELRTSILSCKKARKSRRQRGRNPLVWLVRFLPLGAWLFPVARRFSR